MDNQTSTCDLVERFKKGEQAAFSLLFGKYQRRLAVLVHYKMSEELHGRMEVDDILQEVFVAAAQGLGRFTYQTPGSFMAWLSRIADHAIVDAARHENRRKRSPEELVRFKSESNPNGPEPVDFRTPSQLFAQQESVQMLLRKLDTLPAEYREVILLAKFEGLTTGEISERLGKSRESVALTLHRALKRFREAGLTTEQR
ncbi:MAG TPA: sigma-70 family RNA polymerase sigma factor [Candidatus Acidoferrum sp.]|nr:sigma-70 family RNA polymerase sigma factor [Candidatus Acidoferrum sp.]